jgi:hypothetical protein
MFKFKAQHILIGQQFQPYRIVKGRMPGNTVFFMMFRLVFPSDAGIPFM